MTNKTKIIVGGLLVLITLAAIGQIYTKRKGRIEFEHFYNSEIHGVIERKVRASVSGTYFKVNGQTYNFHPYTSDINNNSIFSYTADIGDTIFKKKRGDTLLLIKPGTTYKYTFHKLTDK